MRALQCQCACLQIPAAVLLPVNSCNNRWSCSSSWRVCNGNPAIAVGVSTLFSQPITSAEQIFLKTTTTTTTTTQSGREVRRGFSRRAWRRRFITPRLVAEYSEAGVTGTAGNGRGVLLTEEAGTEAVKGGGDSLLSTVGTPSPLPSPRTLSPADQQLVGMYFTACLGTGFLATLLLAAIPSLIALRKAAEAFEKLANAAREELPGTMAAVRLSGMEISDLTMELSDLGQEISKGVRSSSRALTAAEAGIHQMGSIASTVWQKQASAQVEVARPLVARVAKQTREALVQARSVIRSLITLSHISSWVGKSFRFPFGRTNPALSTELQKKQSRI
ncbi:hypothetical protein CY35_05G052500 [Sphagnum magellanicum]|nr:hypothetical protein CY35_05G052500 [Sphagnum magellanicum]KAH9562044.1 hypothetical protein CY35_05G052500 [Sphagnum magellanicum]KAH9562045.1 hypothetical protein CY35_05G052500 [Sphagnum magellanicum]